jgi:hypothetical protein
MWCTVSDCKRWRIHRYVIEPFEELFGFVLAEASFPVHEFILVNKILATLWFGTIQPCDPAVDTPWCENVQKLHYIFLFFTFFDVILCNFLRYVTFMFFNVYVLETLRLVTKNVWWCNMKCDVYVLKILRMVQYTLCANTFSNITSCDINVRLRYVM